MILIDNDILDIVASAKLGFVATVNPDGSPNLSPKGSIRVYDDDHVAFMDIASPTTIENLSANPRIEIAVVDFLRRRGYRFSGTAELHQPGSAVHTWLHQWLLELNGPGYPANQAVLVKVERVRPILSPAYTYGDTDEQTLVAQFSATYLHDADQPQAAGSDFDPGSSRPHSADSAGVAETQPVGSAPCTHGARAVEEVNA
jgi:predicted pyridoxine 5'-phosphate oxidase superfamily flavin-nucleotide-binding protein